MERVNENKQEYRNGDSGVKYLFRGPKIDWGVIRFPPGDQLGHHYHERVEETFYFRGAGGRMIVQDKSYAIEAGDAFRIEPGEHHNIVNDTSEVMDIIFIKSAYDPKDKKSVES